MSALDELSEGSKAGKSRFRLGRVVATTGVSESLSNDEMTGLIRRHVAGDWGEVNAHDAEENELGLRNGLRIFSVYRARDGRKVWVITEADRSSTTIMFPEDC
jgi:hypothetical protein